MPPFQPCQSSNHEKSNNARSYLVCPVPVHGNLLPILSLSRCQSRSHVSSCMQPGNAPRVQAVTHLGCMADLFPLKLLPGFPKAFGLPKGGPCRVQSGAQRAGDARSDTQASVICPQRINSLATSGGPVHSAHEGWRTWLLRTGSTSSAGTVERTVRSRLRGSSICGMQGMCSPG